MFLYEWIKQNNDNNQGKHLRKSWNINWQECKRDNSVIKVPEV